VAQNEILEGEIASKSKHKEETAEEKE